MGAGKTKKPHLRGDTHATDRSSIAWARMASRQLFGNRSNGRSQIITPRDQSPGSHRKCKVTRVARGTALQLGFDAVIKHGSGILQIR